MGRGQKNTTILPPVPFNDEVTKDTELRTVIGNWLVAKYGVNRPATDVYYRHNAFAFVDYIASQKGRVTLADLHSENVNTFARMRKAKRSEFSARAAIITLRALGNWVAKNTKYQPKLGALERYKVNEEKRQPLNDDEVQLALSAAQHTQLAGRDYPLLFFFLGTGMRLREVQTLRLRDVSFPGRAIHVRAEISKNGRGREVTLFDDVSNVLVAYIRAFRAEAAPNDPLWVDRDGKQMTSEAIRGVGRAIRKKSGVETFGWHVCRHTYATNARRAGMDIFRLREELGHADFKTLARYAKTLPPAQRSELPSPVGIIQRGQLVATGDKRQSVANVFRAQPKKSKLTMKYGALVAEASTKQLSHWGVAKR